MRATPTDQKTRMGTVILSDGSLDYSFKGVVPLNRSRKWQPAKTYQEARDASPSHRPVR